MFEINNVIIVKEKKKKKRETSKGQKKEETWWLVIRLYMEKMFAVVQSEQFAVFNVGRSGICCSTKWALAKPNTSHLKQDCDKLYVKNKCL